MFKNLLIVTGILLFTSFAGICQKDSIDNYSRFSVNASVGGKTIFYGLNGEYLLTKNLGIGIGFSGYNHRLNISNYGILKFGHKHQAVATGGVTHGLFIYNGDYEHEMVGNAFIGYQFNLKKLYLRLSPGVFIGQDIFFSSDVFPWVELNIGFNLF